MGLRIVVVEDEPDILDLLHDVLELEGHSVVGLNHPRLARSLDPTLRPDLFLIDLMLPTLSGIELAVQLRESGFADVPMIAMSASELLLRMVAESGDFVGTLAKPFNVTNLLESINRYVPASGASDHR